MFVLAFRIQELSPSWLFVCPGRGLGFQSSPNYLPFMAALNSAASRALRTLNTE